LEDLTHHDVVDLLRSDAAPLERAVLPQVEDVVAGVNAALERAPVEEASV